MSYRLFHSGPASALFGPSPLAKANEAEVLADAAALLERARQIHAGAEATRAEALAQGRDEGRREALAEREAYAAQRLAPLIEDLARAQDLVRRDIGELALSAVRRMLADLPGDIAVAALAEKAVATLALDAIERIAVAPALAEPVAERLPPRLARLVATDDKLGPGDCIIHANAGQVIASLDLQLERLAERWGVEARV